MGSPHPDRDDDVVDEVIAAVKAGTTWRHGVSRSHSTWRVKAGGPDATGAYRFIEELFDEGFTATTEWDEAHLRAEVRRLLPQARGILPKPPRR